VILLVGNRVDKVCSEIMGYLVERGFTNQVHVNEVVKAIIHLRGPDKRTINNWVEGFSGSRLFGA